MTQPITHMLLTFFQGLFVCVIALLVMGWTTQIKCWLQNRSAPSVFLPYYTVSKLLLKQPVLADNASWLFRFAPYVYFVSLVILCFNLPFFVTSTFTSHVIDMIVLVGLFALGRILLALAAMDIGTAFGSLGARREMFVACLTEPILFLVFFNVALLTHSPYLNSSSVYLLSHAATYPSLTFSFIALVLIALAETKRIPVDNPATHLELTMLHEAMILEYSGRYLALIEWGNALKFTLYLGFIAALFIPYGLSEKFNSASLLIGLLTAGFKLLIFAAIIGFIESINSKLRLFKIPDYLAGAFMLAVLGVLITQLLGTVL